MKFDNMIKEKYGILSEVDTMPQAGGTTGAPAMDAPPVPAPAPVTPPPAPEEVKYDKPYADLAQLLYKALRINFDKLPEDLQNKVHRVVPSGIESIDNDQKGTALFKAVDEIVKDQDMVPTATSER